jgi:hypothetical protein
MHLWIIFMLLLLVLGILFVILRILIHDCGGYFDLFRQGSNIAHSPQWLIRVCADPSVN